ncbi:hypothetical protein HAX54_048952 [Datura stramonium]|uniref:Uncharacterized protein n=1 Tax=Datura stramonium TaxID=4076 RepID=A0ABS8WJX9_DATST|nr:hypothetical protein [Datura stramonium]
MLETRETQVIKLKTQQTQEGIRKWRKMKSLCASLVKRKCQPMKCRSDAKPGQNTWQIVGKEKMTCETQACRRCTIMNWERKRPPTLGTVARRCPPVAASLAQA